MTRQNQQMSLPTPIRSDFGTIAVTIPLLIPKAARTPGTAKDFTEDWKKSEAASPSDRLRIFPSGICITVLWLHSTLHCTVQSGTHEQSPFGQLRLAEYSTFRSILETGM
ncbi:hypothetical protein ACMFMF_007036 [Clarireedia jacksonii]